MPRVPPVTHRSLPQMQSDIALGVLALDDAATELADAGRLQDLASLLAGRAAFSLDSALHILEDCAETPIAVLCRSAGFSLNGYSAVLRLGAGVIAAAPKRLRCC